MKCKYCGKEVFKAFLDGKEFLFEDKNYFNTWARKFHTCQLRGGEK